MLFTTQEKFMSEMAANSMEIAYCLGLIISFFILFFGSRYVSAYHLVSTYKKFIKYHPVLLLLFLVSSVFLIFPGIEHLLIKKTAIIPSDPLLDFYGGMISIFIILTPIFALGFAMTYIIERDEQKRDEEI
jgi:hypothetical protein